MEASPAPPQSPRAEMGAIARIVGVFFAPARVFESVARRPSWLLPVGLLLAFSLGGGWLVTSRLDPDAIVEKQLAKVEEGGRTMSESDVASMRKWVTVGLKIQFVISAAVGVLVLLAVPGLYHGLALAAGKATSYAAVFSAYAHVQMVQLLKGILLVAVALGREEVDPEEIPRLLKSNVGAFLDREALGSALQTFLTQLDLFDLWGIALAILALTKVTRLGRGGAAAVVLSLWGLYVLVVTALGAIGGAFGG